MRKLIGFKRIAAVVAGLACAVLWAGSPSAQTTKSSEIQVKTIQINPGQVTVVQTNSGLITLNKNTNPNLNKPVAITVQSPQKPSGPVCGGSNQPRCGGQPAVFESAALGNCPKGSFFDIGLWQCWSCPAGFNRSAAAVDSDRACSKPNNYMRGEFTEAKFLGPVCPPDSFYDPMRDGECRMC
ncbi:MAG: hypothetical protein VW405_23525, partial [Rhodospirillaceae bacterium]